MSKVNFTLPQLEVVISGSTPKEALLAVAGGRLPQSKWLEKAALGRVVVCADKGVEACLSVPIIPNILLGDCDSASKELYDYVQTKGAVVYKYPREKDDTDLQLLLQELPDGDLLCSGIWGGRFDHLYSNVFSLLKYKLVRHNQVIMADEKEVMVLLAAGEAAKLCFKQQPYAISMLPLSGTTMVDLDGVHWPLQESVLELLHPYAISNEAEADTIVCNCYSGYVGLYCCFEKA